MKVLVATEKPFAAVAVNGIKEVLDNAGVEMVLLEKYPDKAALLKQSKMLKASLCAAISSMPKFLTLPQN